MFTVKRTLKTVDNAVYIEYNCCIPSDWKQFNIKCDEGIMSHFWSLQRVGGWCEPMSQDEFSLVPEQSSLKVGRAYLKIV